MSHMFCRLKIINLYITRSQQWSQEDIEGLTILAAGKKIAPSRNQRPYEEGQDTLSTWRTRLQYHIYFTCHTEQPTTASPRSMGLQLYQAFFICLVLAISKRASIEKLIAEEGTRISAIERSVPRAW